MKFTTILSIAAAAGSAFAASQDYARHLELNFLFYEAQRSGPLPSTNRIPWRGDSGLDHGSDVGVDLTGGYYDAGDNVKFNFPQAFSMTAISWMGIEFAKGVEMANQTEYLKDTVKWGCDYLLKCHEKGTDVFYMQVGDGDIDHQYWKAYENIDYPTPTFFVDSKNPGTEVTGETAAAFAAASILFKDSDPEYSATLLDQAKEWYEFADKYQFDYSQSVPAAGSYYKSYNGYNDELAWAAIWLYRALGDEAYLEKAKSLVANYKLSEVGIDWDSKYQGVIVILAQLGVKEYVEKVEAWVKDICTNGKFSPGGLYINKDSEWGSNRRATAMAASLIYYTHNLPEGNELREMAKKFAKSQADYIQGANPLGIDYVVGADETSPRSVHHRTASGAACIECDPVQNVHIIYGALAGGPDVEDNYLDDRADYKKNEVALDYNVCYAAVLAYLVEEGLNVEDPIPAWEYDYRITKGADPVQPSEPTEACWSEKLGYPCCPSDRCHVLVTDESGSWGVYQNEWCGIDTNVCKSDCWSTPLGYQCCPSGCKAEVYETDDNGKWGYENGKWCGVPKDC
ncbi:hypothetical protein LY90DRAFT_462502 [Neocallimastix californiae]|uniref:cellulase n=1 Tax=Neocallimastix californiae TaxID=1754190 RepID=A0A1Y2AME7_9FUNG|nr:hypothetical protein LY90DRAFT_462502 [Neocallimastix californiae]|eukprot:ORY23748.1 hypothetical protein LY90DRAFT_462502 [Neocallimastix californiae]